MDAKTARTANIRQWVADAGGPAEFARRYGAKGDTVWAQAQVSQWISEASPKGIGHALAREIEARVGQPPGSMDRPPSSQSVSVTGSNIRTAIELARKAVHASGQGRFDPEDEVDSEITARALLWSLERSIEVVSDSNVLQFMRAMSEKRDDEGGRTPQQDGGPDRAAGSAQGRKAAAAGAKGKPAPRGAKRS